MNYVIDPPAQSSVRVSGGGLFPVRRIFCIGRNYADHVREMGGDPKANPPVFFTKPADAVVADAAVIAYPQATNDLHYEGELVVALKSGGRDIPASNVSDMIFGYAAGCDLTRRDHQKRAKEAGAPWDTAKGFDHSAPVGDIIRANDIRDLASLRLQTIINGEVRQDAPLANMIWPVEEIVSSLSQQFDLQPGDLIFTGTPEGVGPLNPGDDIKVVIGLLTLSFGIASHDQ